MVSPGLQCPGRWHRELRLLLARGVVAGQRGGLGLRSWASPYANGYGILAPGTGLPRERAGSCWDGSGSRAMDGETQQPHLGRLLLRGSEGLRPLRFSPLADPSLAPGSHKMLRLTEASRFRKGAAGSHPSSEAGESRLRARRCRVQAEGGSVHGSVVRQFPSSLHLSEAAVQLPSSPSLRLLPRGAGRLPSAPPRCEHRPGRFSRSPRLIARRLHQPSGCPDTLSSQRITPSIYVFKGFGKIYWACRPPSVRCAVSRELSAIKLLSPTQVEPR